MISIRVPQVHPREMFALPEIYPFWRGERAAFVRASLLAGIAAERTRLTDARWASLSVTTHDYDGLYEEIGEIVGVADPETAASVCHNLLATQARGLLTANPLWSPIGEAVYVRSYRCPADGPSDPLTNLLTRLTNNGMASLDGALIPI